MDSEDDGAAFQQLLGSFGAHANPAKRARAERLATMKPTDKRRRRGQARLRQFNVRVTQETQVLATKLCEAEGWSQADMVEAAIVALAKAKGIKGDG